MVIGKYRMELAELVKMGARARLRSAAPALLSALTDLVGGCSKEGNLFSCTAMANARAAIAKATGEKRER